MTGFTATPPRSDLHKTALGSEESVAWEYYEDPSDAAKKIKKEGITLILVEQTVKSVSIYDLSYRFPVCFIVGNEVEGVSERLSSMADIHAELPMRGVKQSLNVSVAAGIIGYELLRVYLSSLKE